MIGTIFRNVYGITIGLDVGTELGSLDRSFDGYNYGKLEGLFLGELLGSYYVVHVGATGDWSEPNPNPNPKLGSLYRSFDGSNDVKLF